MNNLISITMVVDDCEELLADCLESVLKQDSTDYEVVIIDNASKDDTLKIASEYMHKLMQKGIFCRLTTNRRKYDTKFTAGMAYGPTIGDYTVQITPEMRLPENFVSEISKVITEKKPGAIILYNKESMCEDKGVILDFAIKSGQVVENRLVRNKISKHRETFLNFQPVYQAFLYSIIDSTEMVKVDYVDVLRNQESDMLLTTLEKYCLLYACKGAASIYKQNVEELIKRKYEEIKEDCLKHSCMEKERGNEMEQFRYQQLAKLF